MAADIVVVHDASDFLDRATKKPAAGVKAASLYDTMAAIDYFESDASDRIADYRVYNIGSAATRLCAARISR